MATPISIREEKYFDNVVFPLTLGPKNIELNSLRDLEEWILNNKQQIDKLLLKHKGILFRNFKVVNANDFHQVVVSLDYLGMDYVGGAAVRTQITDRVFTANESPASEIIPFHHEMAQTPSPPTHLLFYCEKEPDTGGETPILLSSYIYNKINDKYPEFIKKIEKLGLKYIRYMPEDDDPTSAIGRGWKSTFLTDSREGAEKALKSLNSTWEWLSDGSLKTITTTVPGIRIDEGINRTNEKTFFNSIVAAYAGWNDKRNVGEKAVVFSDGSECDPTIMADAYNIMNENCVAFKWQEGDVLLLDNRTTMHARRPFTGSRRVLASLARDPSR